jgi:formylglycine-generating enzyme required for sulfatase activity
MLVVPGGSYLMGSPPGEVERLEREGPQHTVKIAGFALGKYAVTFAEWDACIAAGGCTHNPDDVGWGRGRRPVVKVSWEDARQYAEWLAKKTGLAYRLPSEAEWEYAARAGTTTPFNTGNCINTSQANYNGNYDYADCGAKTWNFREKTVAVGTYPANAFGLHEMHGNVWQWVADCWNDSYSGAPSDGSAWLTGDCKRRVVRGGSWDDYPTLLRSARRYWGGSGGRYAGTGFRVARALNAAGR